MINLTRGIEGLTKMRNKKIKHRIFTEIEFEIKLKKYGIYKIMYHKFTKVL